MLIISTQMLLESRWRHHSVSPSRESKRFFYANVPNVPKFKCYWLVWLQITASTKCVFQCRNKMLQLVRHYQLWSSVNHNTMDTKMLIRCFIIQFINIFHFKCTKGFTGGGLVSPPKMVWFEHWWQLPSFGSLWVEFDHPKLGKSWWCEC